MFVSQSTTKLCNQFLISSTFSIPCMYCKFDVTENLLFVQCQSLELNKGLVPYYCTKICISICYIFLFLQIFLRKYHLLLDNQKDPIPIKFTASSLFFQLKHVNTKPTNLESQFYHFSSSRYLFYKIVNIQKALI